MEYSPNQNHLDQCYVLGAFEIKKTKKNER